MSCINSAFEFLMSLIIKLMPAFSLEISTASSSASLMARMEAVDKLGMPEEGVTLCILVNMFADYFLTASHGWTQLDMITIIASRLKLLDVEQLRK